MPNTIHSPENVIRLILSSRLLVLKEDWSSSLLFKNLPILDRLKRKTVVMYRKIMLIAIRQRKLSVIDAIVSQAMVTR